MTQYDPSVSLAAQLPAAGKGQTEQRLTQAEAQLKSWCTELSGYINTPFTGNLDLTLKGKLTSDGRLDESSVQLLIADGNDLVPAENVLPRSDSQCKADGISIMQEALADNSASIPTIQASFTYDRMAAKEYADQWTSNAPGPSYYDTAKWHLQKYPGSVAYTGGDCVDYVSQALVAGGMPQDSSWTAYTPAWLSLSKFLPYMTGKGYLIKSNFTAAAAGAVRIFLDSSQTPYHIVMITKNDTRTRWYSGHTHDQRQQPYSDDANKLYYVVRGAQ